MAGIEYVRPCTRSARAAGCHVRHDRHRRGQYRPDDVAHGRVEAAGCIHLKYDDGAALIAGVRERLLDVTTHGGSDGAGEFDQGCIAASVRGVPGTSARCRTPQQQDNRKPPHAAVQSTPLGTYLVHSAPWRWPHVTGLWMVARSGRRVLTRLSGNSTRSKPLGAPVVRRKDSSAASLGERVGRVEI